MLWETFKAGLLIACLFAIRTEGKSCTETVKVSKPVTVYYQDSRTVDYETCLGLWCSKKSRTEFIKKTRISTVQISRDEEVCCPGYFGEPPDNCQDVNECDSGNGGCLHDCYNTVGSYYCSCDEGYELASDGKSCNLTNNIRVKRGSQTLNYYVSAMLNYASSSTGYYLYITTTSSSAISYSVKSKYTTYSTGTLTYSSPAKISLSTSLITTASFSWSNRHRGIQVYTSGPSNLFVFNYLNHAIGEYPAYPYEKLSGVSTYTYYTVSTGTKDYSSRSQILLVGNEDSTTITVYPKATMVFPSNPQSYYTYSVYSSSARTFTLNRFQTLLLRASSYSTNLSGTKVTSNKPLTVVTGHQCGNIPTNYVYCEHISEQIPPTVDWGKEFMLTPYKNRNRQYFQVMSQASWTLIQHNCNGYTYSAYKHAGYYLSFYTSGSKYCYLKSNKPVLVTQMAPGRGVDGYGDPAISVIPPMNKYDTSTSLYIPSYSYIVYNTINIIAKKKTGTWKIQSSGSTLYVPYSQWITIRDLSNSVVGYCYRRSVLTNRGYRITNSLNNEFYVLGYGFGVDVAYSFTAGILSSNCDTGYELVNGVCQDINECTATPNICGSKHCFNNVGSYTCDCKSGYELKNSACVDINECSLNDDKCEYYCYNTAGSYYCGCPTGYVLYNSYFCKDKNECSYSNGGCAQICTNTIGSFTCSCNPGYTKSGKYCYDVNECNSNKGGCQHSCINTYGSYYCTCNSGYYLTGNGKDCQDINECSYATCVQDCVNTQGSYYCTCYPGYSGSNCADANECLSNNGGCAHKCTNIVGSFHCSCNTGYKLSSNGKSCIEINECSTNNGGCSHTCTNTAGSYYCSCNSGYTLDGDDHGCSPNCPDSCGHCSTCNSPNSCTCTAGWKGNDCCTDINECLTNNGGCQQLCHNAQGSFTCDCNVGYTLNSNKKKCNDINECVKNTDGCNQNCINTAGSYQCSCNSGYELGLDSQTCVDTNECENNNGGCAQTCTNTVGSYYCSCKTGYTLSSNGKGCNDINECSLNTDDCSNACYNTIGSYKCGCPVGYELSDDGITCEDTDECASDNGGCDQTCVNEDGSYHCECLPGYTLDSDQLGCSDHDECSNNNHACDQNCFNSHSSYYCTCDTGYTLEDDGRTCTDINECTEHTSGCSHKCTNTAGSYSCSCFNGYTLDSNGRTCSDNNECSSNNGGCDHSCTNTNGSFTCSCNDGYELGFNETSCNDVNECVEGTDFCEHNCINNIGSYSCSCYTGYQESDDGYHCSDINECDTDDGGCDHTCINSVGSFYCTCKEGYNLDSNGLNCNDINECDVENGGCEHNCINTPGSYYCSCDDGYTLDLGEEGCLPNCPDACGNCAECKEPNLCKCNSGWMGNDCCTDINECSTDNGGCKQICHNVNGSRACDCKVGFTLNSNLVSCDDIDECALDTDGCNQMCTNTEGSYYCYCNTGYELELDGLTCVDTNECGIQNGGCNQTCVNTVASYHCECDNGYTLNSDGHGCDDNDECALNTDECSHTCYNNIGSYTCDCPLGYELMDDQVTCQDIDECSVDNAGCNQTCVNEVGSYHCECLEGYLLDEDQKGCSDHDECKTNVHLCDQHCHNSHSSYYCTCSFGYTLDDNGRTCNDVNECAEHLSGCNQICNNTVGTYVCDCFIGYELGTNLRTCIDVNECLFNNGGCEQNCSNLIGSYYCSCDSGYELNDNKHNCDDLDECALGTDLCEHKCFNDIGSYHCGCNTGYYLETNGLNCSDVDECQVDNAGCNQTCVNEIGSYHCECLAGYALDDDLHGCYDVDECQKDNGGCDHNCHNLIGSYYCTCHDGYDLLDDSHSCYGQKCNESLVAPGNGTIICTGEQVTDESCSFDCIPGYELQRSATRRCKADHTWTGEDPYCQPRHCRSLKRPLNAYVVTEPCPTVLMSECVVECVEGYHVINNELPMYQKCLINATTNKMFWSDPPRCVYKPPCSSNPCTHGGRCRNLNSFDYKCNCDATGYTGIQCETGIISIPQIPMLEIGEDGSTTSTITISAYPTTGLDVHVKTSDKGITTLSSTLQFSSTVTSATLTVTGKIPGIHYIYFNVTGHDADSFESPRPMVIIIHNPNIETNHTRFQYFELMGQPVGILVPGCCEQIIQSYFTPQQTSVDFNSSCAWRGLSTSQFTGGITFSSSSNLGLPLSVTGSELGVLSNAIPSHTMPSMQQECTTCGSQEPKCEYYVTHEDVIDFISCNALLRTFLNNSNILFPDWFMLTVTAPHSDSLSFSSSDIHAELLLGSEVILIRGCENIQVQQDSLYSVYRYNDTLTVTIDGINNVYEPQYGDVPLCLAVEISKGDKSTVQIGIPTGYHNKVKNIPPFQMYDQNGWEIFVYEFSVSTSGINIREEDHVAFPEYYFDGETLLASSAILSEFDVRLETQILKNFTSKTYTAELVFYGDLYHKRGQSQVQGALVGMITLRLNLVINGKAAELYIEQIPGQPALFTLPEYTYSGTVISGISFKMQYQPPDDKFFSTILRSDLQYCPANVFIGLSDDGGLSSAILHTSCPSLHVGGLTMPVNSLEHIITIPLQESGQPTVILSDYVRGTLQVNEFLSLRQPDHGKAVTVMLYPDGTISGEIRGCTFSLFETVFTTDMSISDTVTFTAPEVDIFQGLFEVSLTGRLKNGLEKGDISVTVTGEILLNSTFADDTNNHFQEYVSEQVKDMNERFEIIKNAKLGIQKLFDHYYMILQEKAAILEAATASYNSSLEEVKTLKSVLQPLQYAIYDLIAEDSVLADSLDSVCKVVSCADSCAVSDSLMIQECDYPINEWGIGKAIKAENFSENIEVETLLDEWALDYTCRIVTNIKSWGVARYGQICSYANTPRDEYEMKWVLNQKEVNVSRYSPTITNTHSLFLKVTESTDSICGMKLSSSNCALSNAACRIIQEPVVNYLISTNNKAEYQTVIDYNVAKKNLDIARSKSSSELYKMSVAQHDFDIHKSLLNDLVDLSTMHDEFYSSLQEESIGLLEVESQLGTNESVENIFQLLSLKFSATIDDYSPTTLPLTIQYNIPLYMETFEVTTIIDFHSPFTIIQREIASAVLEDLKKQLVDTKNRTERDVVIPSVNQQHFDQYCAMIENVKNYLMEINQSLSNAADCSTKSIAKISEINYDQESVDLDLNTVVKFNNLPNYGISTTLSNLMSQAQDDEDYVARKEVVLMAKLFASNITDIVESTEHLSWFVGVNKLHNVSLIDSVSGQQCFGFADCLKMVGILLNQINNDFPKAIFSVEDDILESAEDLLYSLALGVDYRMQNSTWELIQPMYDIVLQFENNGYWCEKLPVITQHPQDYIYAEINSEVTLRCGPAFDYNYEWSKNGFLLETKSPELVISNISRRDEGQYQCAAKNTAGKTYSTFSELRVVIRPEITQSPSNTSTFEGSEDEALFICNGTGGPTPSFTWYYSVDRLYWTMVYNRSNEYVVYKPTKQQEGWYRCSATVLDYVEYSEPAYLTVIGASISRISYLVSFEMAPHGKLPTDYLHKLHDVVEAAVKKDEIWQYGYIEKVTTKLATDENNLQVLFVSFRLTTSYNYSLVIPLFDQANEAGIYKQEVDNILFRIRERLIDGSINFEYNGTFYNSLPNTFIVSEEFYRCPLGQALAYNGFICLNCSVGHYSNIVKNVPSCVPCEQGTYTNQVGQGECSTCPEHMSTLETGLLTGETCTEQCEPGEYSENGLVPCMKCGEDEYQSEYGRKSCLPCNNQNLTQCPPVFEPRPKGYDISWLTSYVVMAATFVTVLVLILIIATLVICGYKRKAMKEKGRSNPREELDEQIHRDVLPEFDQLRRVEQRNPLYDVYMEEDINDNDFEYSGRENALYDRISQCQNPMYAEISETTHTHRSTNNVVSSPQNIDDFQMEPESTLIDEEEDYKKEYPPPLEPKSKSYNHYENDPPKYDDLGKDDYDDDDGKILTGRPISNVSRMAALFGGTR